jgi:hypothetical protein
MRRLLAAALLCLAVAACGAEEDVPEPVIVDEPVSSAAVTTAAPASETATPAESSLAEPIADVLDVRCLANGTTSVGSTRVRPGPAGVATRVTNETDGRRAVLLETDEPAVTPTLEAGSTSETVQVLRPGAVDVGCSTEAVVGETLRYADHVAVEIVDDAGLWRPATVECPEGDQLGIPPPAGWTAYPALTREQLPDELRDRFGLTPEDEVRPGGYPEQERPTLVAVRDGRVVLSATPTEVDGGGWDLGEVWGCDSDGLIDAAMDEMPLPEDVEAATAEAVSVESLPDIVDVRCTTDGTIVSADLVEPGPAGVRLRITNDTDAPLRVVVQGAGADHGGEQQPGATTEVVAPLAPNLPVDVACYDPTDPTQDPPTSPGYLRRVTQVLVVDDEGLWQPASPECADEEFAAVAGSYGPDAGMPRADLPDALRQRAHLTADDMIRPGGYPEQENPPLVAVRDGRVVAVAFPVKVAQGWEIGELQGCTADGLVG